VEERAIVESVELMSTVVALRPKEIAWIAVINRGVAHNTHPAAPAEPAMMASATQQRLGQDEHGNSRDCDEKHIEKAKWQCEWRPQYP
jgi:hypothetical protein